MRTAMAVGREQLCRKRQRKRRLAGPAGDQIADADHRQAATWVRSWPGAWRRRATGGIEQRSSRQQRGQRPANRAGCQNSGACMVRPRSERALRPAAPAAAITRSITPRLCLGYGQPERHCPWPCATAAGSVQQTFARSGEARANRSTSQRGTRRFQRRGRLAAQFTVSGPNMHGSQPPAGPLPTDYARRCVPGAPQRARRRARPGASR